MAANLIQIKRSQTTGTPTSLANGEMAFTAAGNVVFIGNYGTVLAIAGERNPGVLTANQALVANSTSYIDKVKVANAFITGLTANGFIGNDGNVLAVDGTGKIYWSTTAAAGPSFVQNTDSRVLSGNLTLTGANTTINNLYSGNTYVNTLTSGRVTYAGASGKLTDSTNLQWDNGNQVLKIGAGGTELGGDSGYGYIKVASANVTSKVTIGDSPSATLSGNTTTGYFTGTSYNANNAAYLGGTIASDYALKTYADSAFSNAAAKADNAYANAVSYIGSYQVPLGTQTTGDYVQNVTAGNGINVSVSSGEGSTPVISINVGTGLISNTSGLFVDSVGGQTFESITVNGEANLFGNTQLGSDSNDEIIINGRLASVSEILPKDNNAINLGSSSLAFNGVYSRLVSVGNVHLTSADEFTLDVMGALSVNSSITANTGTIYHDFFIGGDLHISGSAVYSNVESYVVTDPLIQLGANNNLVDLLDIGFFGNYGTDENPDHHKHTGLFRDASDGVYKFFTNLDVAPTTFVDTGDSSYMQATLQAYLNSGALISNSTVLNITATDTLAVALVANSLTLSTALGYASGGTGYKTYTNGDLLVGNTSAGLKKLSAGLSGYVLQSDGTNLYYGSLDGGTF